MQERIQIETIIADALALLRSSLEKAHLTAYFPMDQEIMPKGLRYTLLFLNEALLFNKASIFFDNISWYQETYGSTPFAQHFLTEALKALSLAIAKRYPSLHSEVEILIQGALEQLPLRIMPRTSYLDEPGVDARSHTYLDALLTFDEAQAREILLSFFEEEKDIRRVFRKMVQPVQYEIGRLWQLGLISVAQEHFCTESASSILDSMVQREGRQKREEPGFLGLCVEGEWHSMGIKTICHLLNAQGRRALFLGASAPSSGISSLIEKENIKVLGISVAMPYNVHQAAKLITELRAKRQSAYGLQILVGGSVFNRYPDLVEKVGADGHAFDAESAVSRIEEALLGDMRETTEKGKSV